MTRTGREMRRLVVVDLDGTVTKSDTLIPFLMGCFLRHPRFNLRLLFLPLDLLRFAIGQLSPTDFKERLLTAFVGGLLVSSVERWAREFAGRITQSGCNSEVLSFIEQYQSGGDRLIVLSASPDLYVRFIAESLGIAETVSTLAEVQSARYTGRLVGENCKGAEKVQRLKEYLEPDCRESITVAVGNEESDLPVLEWADEGWMVRNGHMLLLKACTGSPVREI